jgi:hypothetical protein
MLNLNAIELTRLVMSVFPSLGDERHLAILVDIPGSEKDDTGAWVERRNIAFQWFAMLQEKKSDLGSIEKIRCIAYPDVGSNNADLPEFGYELKDMLPPSGADFSDFGKKISFSDLFSQCQLLLAPTQYSTTAPLKNAARIYDFRAATMPGFSPQMIPALRIDYNEVFRRVEILKEKLDAAVRADTVFTVDGRDVFKVSFDLKHRKAHMSSGRFPDRGTAGNVPSGETYIVPYEGEAGEESATEGLLPVQIGSEVVLFEIAGNRAQKVDGYSGKPSPVLEEERGHLSREPAYGNMAELGFGVLADFGIQPIGEILLDEKLGFHIAFGRSDHFGGAVGPEDFSSPAEVIHLDQVYIPALQPRVAVTEVSLEYPEKERETIIADNVYRIF